MAWCAAAPMQAACPQEPQGPTAQHKLANARMGWARASWDFNGIHVDLQFVCIIYHITHSVHVLNKGMHAYHIASLGPRQYRLVLTLVTVEVGFSRSASDEISQGPRETRYELIDSFRATGS